MKREPDLGEQALDKAAEIALESQLDQVEQIDVDIRSNPGKLVQGKVDSVAISGEGMVMKKDLRVDAAEIHTDEVAINPLKAVLGEIELTQPTNAHAQILLTEADLNRALSSDYLRSKMTDLSIEMEQKPVRVDLQQVNVHLPSEHQLVLNADIRLNQESETKQFSATARPFLQDEGQRIEFEILSAEGKGLSLEFIKALLSKVIELLDLRNFELSGLSLQLKDLDIQAGKLLLRANTRVDKFPSP